MSVPLKSQKNLAAFFAVCLIAAYFIRYTNSFAELCWSFSQFVAIGAMAPQLYALAVHSAPQEKVDWGMLVYVLAFEAFRLFHIPVWILRQVSEHLY